MLKVTAISKRPFKAPPNAGWLFVGEQQGLCSGQDFRRDLTYSGKRGIVAVIL